MTKNHCSSKNREKGFSLVEVLVAAGTLGLVALGLAKLAQQQMKSTSTVQANYEIAAILNEMRTILSDPNNCQTTFEGENAASSSAIGRLRKGSTDKFVIGKKYGQGKVKINSYKLSNKNKTLADDETHLLIEFSRGRASFREIVVKRIVLQVEPDNQSNITNCLASSAGGTSSIWQRGSGTNIDDIFFSSGKVGIGTTDPTTLLDVNGEAKFDSLQVENEAKVNFLQVKAASFTEGESCAGEDEGKIRYNINLKGLEVCDGSKFKSVGQLAPLESDTYVVTSTIDNLTFSNTGCVGFGGGSESVKCKAKCQPGDFGLSGGCDAPEPAVNVKTSTGFGMRGPYIIVSSSPILGSGLPVGWSCVGDCPRSGGINLNSLGSLNCFKLTAKVLCKKIEKEEKEE